MYLQASVNESVTGFSLLSRSSTLVKSNFYRPLSFVPFLVTTNGVFIIGTMIKSIYDPQYQALLEYLKEARAKRGLTVRDVAELIDESFQFVSKIETGQRRLTVHEYVQYCQALGVDPVKGLKLLY